MFKHLVEFPVILVTGPQRSGTRICAKMIAHDTGHRFVDEREICTDSLYELMQVIEYQRKEPVVVQCPALSHVVPEVASYHLNIDECAVVFMHRDCEEILASIKRVGWNWGWLEELRYPYWHRTDEPALTKYRYWALQQESLLIRHSVPIFNVQYDSLHEHPLWIPKEERKDFDAWQTEVRDKGSCL